MHTTYPVPGVKMTALTHQKAQVLRDTTRGQQILQTSLSDLPALLKAMEHSLQEGLTIVEKEKGIEKKELLASLLDDHLYWEFGYYILFLKWRESNMAKTGCPAPADVKN
ncbi:hypothetical protein DVR12_24260 [Chitinophaga silvatica]|uniref:Uncharacterized protein n=1 Tax=Chitinophaga silvatica TaxID=2282649 RepID=A0A3E1Y3W8_9BACT|nr:hypothetical protein [Chitinophaga silvatica]RFS19346.1 hypothetical protein DVR12_24260 [Chitinophaga silvatica]